MPGTLAYSTDHKAIGHIEDGIAVLKSDVGGNQKIVGIRES